MQFHSGETRCQVFKKLPPCLWFDDQAEEAVEFYAGIFRHSKILNISRYRDAGHEMHRKRAGTVMVIAFELEGQAFTALNGGPMFKFNEAISFQIDCETQEEVDYYWEKLSEGGPEEARQCGWLKDKYGFLANCSRPPDRDAKRSRFGEVWKGHGSNASDEENRH